MLLYISKLLKQESQTSNSWALTTSLLVISVPVERHWIFLRQGMTLISSIISLKIIFLAGFMSNDTFALAKNRFASISNSFYLSDETIFLAFTGSCSSLIVSSVSRLRKIRAGYDTRPLSLVFALKVWFCPVLIYIYLFDY